MMTVHARLHKHEKVYLAATPVSANTSIQSSLQWRDTLNEAVLLAPGRVERC